MPDTLIAIAYIAASALFIMSLGGLSNQETARRGNWFGIIGMVIALIATAARPGFSGYGILAAMLIAGTAIGALLAARVKMTAMPEMVALFNGAGGGASALVAVAVLWLEVVEPGTSRSVSQVAGHDVALSAALSVWLGTITLSGSVLAYLKLAGTVGNRPRWLVARNQINAGFGIAAAATGAALAWLASSAGEVAGATVVLATLGLAAGLFLVLPIGGADMPVVISLLNALSGVAAAMTGFGHLAIASQ